MAAGVFNQALKMEAEIIGGALQGMQEERA